MEPRSADDSRQLIKLQRGILTAIVAMHNEIMAVYNNRVKDVDVELEKEKQRLYDEIAAPVMSKVVWTEINDGAALEKCNYIESSSKSPLSC